MNKAYVYGKDLVFNLYAYEDKTKITNLPAQTVTGYLFYDQPSRVNAAAGSGNMSSFTQSLTANGTISLTIPAITDPNPSDVLNYRLYWVAVNFILKTAGSTQTVLRSIKVERVGGQDAEIGVSLQTIQDIYPDVLSYLSTGEIDAMISLAKADLLDDLSNKGLDWNQVYQPDQLFNALLFITLVYVYNSQIQREGDRFFVSAEKAGQRYENIKNNLKLAYDSTLGGQKTDEVKSGGIIRLVR